MLHDPLGPMPLLPGVELISDCNVICRIVGVFQFKLLPSPRDWITDVATFCSRLATTSGPHIRVNSSCYSSKKWAKLFNQTDQNFRRELIAMLLTYLAYQMTIGNKIFSISLKFWKIWNEIKQKSVWNIMITKLKGQHGVEARV